MTASKRASVPRRRARIGDTHQGSADRLRRPGARGALPRLADGPGQWRRCRTRRPDTPRLRPCVPGVPHGRRSTGFTSRRVNFHGPASLQLTFAIPSICSYTGDLVRGWLGHLGVEAVDEAFEDLLAGDLALRSVSSRLGLQGGPELDGDDEEGATLAGWTSGTRAASARRRTRFCLAGHVSCRRVRDCATAIGPHRSAGTLPNVGRAHAARRDRSDVVR
jgi:hypothetical protein